MKDRRALPIPFLILILAGLVSLVGLFTSHRARASARDDDAVQVQTVEQERMVAMYFRVSSWLAGVTAPREAAPAHVNRPVTSLSRVAGAAGNPVPPGRIELCTMRLAHNADAKHRRCLN